MGGRCLILSPGSDSQGGRLGKEAQCPAGRGGWQEAELQEKLILRRREARDPPPSWLGDRGGGRILPTHEKITSWPSPMLEAHTHSI